MDTPSVASLLRCAAEDGVATLARLCAPRGCYGVSPDVLRSVAGLAAWQNGLALDAAREILRTACPDAPSLAKDELTLAAMAPSVPQALEALRGGEQRRNRATSLAAEFRARAAAALQRIRREVRGVAVAYPWWSRQELVDMGSVSDDDLDAVTKLLWDCVVVGLHDPVQHRQDAVEACHRICEEEGVSRRRVDVIQHRLRRC
jgi:hypothetical protein